METKAYRIIGYPCSSDSRALWRRSPPSTSCYCQHEALGAASPHATSRQTNNMQCARSNRHREKRMNRARPTQRASIEFRIFKREWGTQHNEQWAQSLHAALECKFHKHTRHVLNSMMCCGCGTVRLHHAMLRPTPLAHLLMTRINICACKQHASAPAKTQRSHFCTAIITPKHHSHFNTARPTTPACIALFT